jgi:hypothetical protein
VPLAEGEQVQIVLSFGYPARPVEPTRRGPEAWIERAARKPASEVVEEI